MRRREFIALIGGAAASWPLHARALQAGRTRRVVFLHSLAENDPEAQARVAAFRQGLETLGWTENRNIQIVHRFSGGCIRMTNEDVVDLYDRTAVGTKVVVLPPLSS